MGGSAGAEHAAGGSGRAWWPRMTARQVNHALALCLVVVFVTGVVSWGVGTEWNRAWTVLHAVAGIALVLLLPRKATTSVRSGLRRGRRTRWLSVTLGVLVVAVVVLGFLHSFGLWYGVGWWSALWTHTALAFVLTPLLVWHVWSRPVRPRRTDVDRRFLLATGTRLAGAAVVLGAAEAITRAVGSGDRRFTGSREVASYEPSALPSVSWIDDRAPDIDVESWVVLVDGVPLDVAAWRSRTFPLDADLDCTGGWWSRQRWDVVRLDDVVAVGTARSVAITSATGYRRIFPAGDASEIYLAFGYGGEPLRRRHGAPVRVVAPGRRGFWWVKWVTDIETTDRPWWLQLPFPPT